METDLTLQVLQSMSHPIRKSIIESLGLSEESSTFSDLMWNSGLNPNFDTGPFWYHLSQLIEIGIVQKDNEKYQLSAFGSEVHKILRVLNRECSFLLKTKAMEAKTKVNTSLKARWATEEDMEDFQLGRDGILPEPQVVKKREVLQKRFEEWESPHPTLTMDSVHGAPFVIERDGKPIVMLWVRKEVRYKLVDTEHPGREPWKGKRKEEFWLFITRVWTWPSQQKEQATREVLEALLGQAKEHNIDIIEATDVHADDETVTRIFKELGFTRISTSYKMRKNL